MTETEVIELMESSQTESEWSDNCDKVKAAFNGQYPAFWWETMKLSGRMDEILGRWGDDSEIRVYTL